MINNYFTLYHLVNELNQEFAGQTILEVFTQHRNELIISFRDTAAVITIGCEPADNYLYARKTFARAHRNSVNLFPEIFGVMIKQISMHPFDRQIDVLLMNDRRLTFQMFGPKANILMLDSNYNVLDLFLKKPKSEFVKGGISVLNIKSNLKNIFKSINGDQKLTIGMKQAFPQFGLVIVQELLNRSNLNGDQTFGSLQEKETERLYNNASQMTEELLSGAVPRIYFDETMPVRFSIVSLQSLNNLNEQKYETFSEAVQTYRANVKRKKSVIQEKEEILKVLERELERINKTLQKISTEAEKPDRAQQYEKFGKLLIAQLHLLKKGDKVALVEDYIGGTNDIIEVPLDHNLTPAKNAERYFEKSEKSIRAAEEQQKQNVELKHTAGIISRVLERMEEVVTEEDLYNFIEENKKALEQFGLKSKKTGHVKKEEPIPFRVFEVEGGFQVWAGKSGENNDLLSTRHTAKNDLWFHARGVGGSHVVLKVGTGKGEVSKKAIEQAARIAAYYSKMKKASLVPVTMCEGKYVRKPKGVPAGTVIVEREKTIFAEPRLP